MKELLFPSSYLPPNLEKPKKDQEKKDVERDDMFSYNSALVADGLYFLNFLDAVSEGDGDRIIRQYKYMLMYCRADQKHSTKYAVECLYHFFLVFALLSPRDRERFTWNRSVNNSGRGYRQKYPLGSRCRTQQQLPKTGHKTSWSKFNRESSFQNLQI